MLTIHELRRGVLLLRLSRAWHRDYCPLKFGPSYPLDGGLLSSEWACASVGVGLRRQDRKQRISGFDLIAIHRWPIHSCDALTFFVSTHKNLFSPAIHHMFSTRSNQNAPLIKIKPFPMMLILLTREVNLKITCVGCVTSNYNPLPPAVAPPRIQ